MQERPTNPLRRPEARGPVAAGATSVALPMEGLRLLLRERSLWGLAVVPLALGVLVVGSTLAGLVIWSGELYSLATDWLPSLEAGAWYTWVWVGPGRLLLKGLGWLFFLGLVGLGLVAAYLVANLLASPFHDVLSGRVEALVAGEVQNASETGFAAVLRDAGRALREELRRLLFFLAVQGSLAFLGFVIPGGQLVAGPAMTLFMLVFLPLDFASYALDRRRIRFAERRRWVASHPTAMLSFGVAAFGLCLVPGVNLLAMPVLVVAGTLLVIRHPPEPEPEPEPEP